MRTRRCGRTKGVFIKSETALVTRKCVPRTLDMASNATALETNKGISGQNALPPSGANFCEDDSMSVLCMFASNLEEISRFGFMDELGRKVAEGYDMAALEDKGAQHARDAREWDAVFATQLAT